MKLDNQTPFQLAYVVLFDKNAAENLFVVLKATYAVGEDGQLSVAKEPDPIRGAEQFYGEPGQSSIRYEAELGAAKPATDIVLHGSAVAPGPETKKMEVAFKVGPVAKRVRVFGERRWKKSLLGLSISGPEPITRVPLTYENAYGGKDCSAKDAKHHGHEPANPVGKGYRAKKSELELAEQLLPNIEDLDKLLSRPGGGGPPQGFGFIGRDWEPRVRYVGTYDAKWQEERMPLLPLDFDERYYNAAHPDLIAPGHLKGGEPVEVLGCTRSGRVAFSLPNLQPVFTIAPGIVPQATPLKLETVLLDTDAMKLNLVWKAGVNIHRKLPQVRTITCRIGSGKV